MKRLLIACIVSIAGCGDAQEAQPVPAAKSKVVVLPPTKEVVTHGMNANAGSYSRTVDAWRASTPFGASPGETIMGVKEFSAKDVKLPTFDPKTGAITGLESDGFTGGSMKPTHWILGLWNTIKTILYWWIGGLILSAILAFIPATAPIGQVLLRILVAPVPALGSAIEAMIGAAKVKQSTAVADANYTVAEQVVAGVERFRRDHPDQWPALKAALVAEQDKDTQAAVRELK
jgi:hypothetical protein